MKKIYRKNIWLAGTIFIWAAVFCMPVMSYGAEPDMSVGLGVAVVPDYEGSDENEAYPLPYFKAVWKSGRFINITGNRIRGNVLAGGTWQFGPVLQFRKKRDDDVDNDAVSKLREVDNAFEAGAFAGFKFGNWDGGVQVVNDVSDEHDGLIATAMAGYTLSAGNLTTRIGVSTSYADDDYMEAYFSIDADNAVRSGLPTYRAESGLKDVAAKLTLRLGMTDNWDIMGLFEFTKLLNDAEDSPVVDLAGDDNQFTGGILVIYNF